MDQNPKIAEKITADIVSRLERSKSRSRSVFRTAMSIWTRSIGYLLFGKEQEPRKFRSVEQPGFWACYETVT